MSAALEFKLPPELEATSPPEERGWRRDEVCLLVSRPEALESTRFDLIASHLEPGDLLVVNDSRTLPAALLDGRLHLSTHLQGNRWVVEQRGSEPLPPLPQGGSIVMKGPYLDSSRLQVAELNLPGDTLEYLQRWGKPIRYRYMDQEWPLHAYQTLFASAAGSASALSKNWQNTLAAPDNLMAGYASAAGSAEMPSAGRAFTQRVLDRLVARGVALAPLTLHTGVSSLEAGERPYPERFEVPETTWRLVQRTRQAGGRVIAVGTTVVRALESVAEHGFSGWTSKVITPAHPPRVVDGLLTGWHEPRATHLDMLAALVGEPRLHRDYTRALEEGYLWHEFGDLHLLLGG